MPFDRVESLLAVLADLEQRDAGLAAEIEQVGELARDADAVRARAREAHELLSCAPADNAALDRAEAEARDLLASAEAALAAAEEHAGDLERRRRAGEDARVQARRELVRAREALVDARARVERVALERASLRDTELAAREGIGALHADAREIVARLRDVRRVSQSGRDAPGPGLSELAKWGGRVHAALFVVRGQLDGERDRLVREANEIGSSVLGEQVAGSSVALVRRRLEKVLHG